mmetsp:Transcript_26055/g.38187  ORF Transcript_26055/g.38187 Transcript_26055/m.38187 type:complete len:112 (+) Transcript_26055:83-418(+)
MRLNLLDKADLFGRLAWQPLLPTPMTEKFWIPTEPPPFSMEQSSDQREGRSRLGSSTSRFASVSSGAFPEQATPRAIWHVAMSNGKLVYLAIKSDHAQGSIPPKTEHTCPV